MLRRKIVLSTALASALISGCSSTPSGKDESLLDRSVNGLSDVGSAITSYFSGYENGTKVEQGYLDSVKAGKTTTKDVEKSIGLPTNKEAIKGGVAWRYPYTRIPHFGANTNETTVFEFDSKGVLKKAYKVKGRSDKVGNPLIDSANGA